MKVLKRRMYNLFRSDGRTLIVAMDGANQSPNVTPNMRHPGELIEKCVAGGADVIMTTYGTAKYFAKEIGGAGLIVNFRPEGPMLDREAEMALRIGADGIKAMIHPWSDIMPNAVVTAATLGDECDKLGLVYLPEVMPGGFRGGPEWRTPEKIAAGARFAAEAGGDFVKTFYTGDPESFKVVIDNCYIPVVILGGEKAESDEDLLKTVKDSLDAGGAGCAFGRNVYQHEHPDKICRAITAVMHDGATVAQALKLLK